MVLFNHATREMTAKIVYYGPGLCGKTTNLMVVFDKLDARQKGKMLSLATKTDRTLFFDLLPVDIGKLGSFNLKIQLYTVPGQVFYNETRKLVLKGADSVVFVADSQASMVDSTRESFANLLENLQENGIDPNDIPIVVQYNKRDLPGILPVEQLQEALGLDGYPYTEASAVKGQGVMETFKLVTKITAKHLLDRMKGSKSEPPPRKSDKKGAATAKIKALAPEPPAPAPVAAAPAPAEVPDNPFASSAAEPFPEAGAAPLDAGYERMEEVSLEQLLEGRERPLTFSGTVAVPLEEVEEVEEVAEVALVEPLEEAEELEEVEELSPEHLVPAEAPAASTAEAAAAPAAVVLPDDGDRVTVLEEQVESLKHRILVMRDEQRSALESILHELDDLSRRVRQQLDA